MNSSSRLGTGFVHFTLSVTPNVSLWYSCLQQWNSMVGDQCPKQWVNHYPAHRECLSLYKFPGHALHLHPFTLLQASCSIFILDIQSIQYPRSIRTTPLTWNTSNSKCLTDSIECSATCSNSKMLIDDHIALAVMHLMLTAMTPSTCQSRRPSRARKSDCTKASTETAALVTGTLTTIGMVVVYRQLYQEEDETESPTSSTNPTTAVAVIVEMYLLESPVETGLTCQWLTASQAIDQGCMATTPSVSTLPSIATLLAEKQSLYSTISRPQMVSETIDLACTWTTPNNSAASVAGDTPRYCMTE
jgi:hypothetical protein